MVRLRFLAGLWALSVAATAQVTVAQEARQPPDQKVSNQETQSAGSPSVTRHTIRIGDQRLDYAATVGSYEVGDAGKTAKARMFYVAYVRDETEPSSARPLTFVFNGGPGAASAYLHLLALGPRVIDLPADGSVPPPPVALKDNAQTWLEFTDLVFIDPVGTGFSHALDDSGDEAAGQPQPGGGYWELDRDLESLAEFIRLYLTRTGRWHSPKFIVGESYGGFRAALLPRRLLSDPGIRLNGIVLVSPVLEFGLQDPGPYNVLPWAALLPSYAATAHRHGKLADERPLEEIAAEAEAFAMNDYLVWLSHADIAAGRKAPPPRLANFLGLPANLVRRNDGRISRDVFRREILSESARIVSLYDGSIKGIDPHPGGPHWRTGDPVLDGLTAPLSAAFSAYVREGLDFKTDAPYRVLNPEVGRNWDWVTDGRGRPEPPGAADSLKEAMSLQDDLMVFVGHGYYDLVTPYLASKYVLAQMSLDLEIRQNLAYEVYEGGHMYYMHSASRAAFRRDIQAFYEQARAGSQSP